MGSAITSVTGVIPMSTPLFAARLMRAGRLSKKARGLVVEVGVPDTLENPGAFVGTTLVQAVEFADDVFTQKRVTADLRRARQIALTVATQLAQSEAPDA